MWYGDLVVRTRPSFDELPEKEQHDALLTARWFKDMVK